MDRVDVPLKVPPLLFPVSVAASYVRALRTREQRAWVEFLLVMLQLQVGIKRCVAMLARKFFHSLGKLISVILTITKTDRDIRILSLVLLHEVKVHFSLIVILQILKTNYFTSFLPFTASVSVCSLFPPPNIVLRLTAELVGAVFLGDTGQDWESPT